MTNFQRSDCKIKVFFMPGLELVGWWEPKTFFLRTYDVKVYIYSEIFSIHYILRKNTNIKKFSFRQNKCYKKYTLFVLGALTHHSFTFNLWSLYELNHKVYPFSKDLYWIFHFWLCLVFTKVYIFVQQ